MKKMILSFIVIAISASLYFYFSQASDDGDKLGEITIKVYDENNSLVIEDTISFTDENTLFDVLTENYTIGCADRHYKIDYDCEFISINSHIILAINDVETDWYGSYLQIFIDGSPSNYGVDLINITDNSVYEFKYVDLGGE